MLQFHHSHTFNKQELLAGFNKRNREAFCLVYQKYYNEFLYFAQKLFRDHPEISPSDAVQDLFLKIWENERQFESFDILKSYFYLSIRNRWKNMLEHAGYVKKYAETQDPHPTDEYVLASMIEAETLAILYQQLNTLPPACARIIRLSLQGLSNQEIADKLSISIHTVYSQKQKAIQILRNQLPKQMLYLLYFLMDSE